MAPIPDPSEVSKNGKPQWLLDLRAQDRGRKFFKSKAAALRYKAEVENELGLYGKSSLSIAPEERIEFASAKQRLGAVGATISQAVDFFLRHYKEAKSATIREAVRACIESKTRTGKRARSVQQLGYTLDSFALQFGSRLCSEISHGEIEQWLHRPEWSLSTRETKRIDVGTLFNFARKQKWCLANPVEDLEPILLEDKPPAIFSVDQCRRLLDETARLDAGFLPYIAIGLFCGLRPSEVMRLTWDKVSLDRGFVDVASIKTRSRSRRITQVPENCVAWLKIGGDLPPKNWQDRLKVCREAAGIDSWPQDVLRHTCASFMVPRLGAAKTAHELGHSEAILYKHYRELVRPEEVEKFWTLMPDPAINPEFRTLKKARGDSEHYRNLARARHGKITQPSPSLES